jgi:hypothetical protein
MTIYTAHRQHLQSLSAQQLARRLDACDVGTLVVLSDLWARRLVVADESGARFWRSLHTDALISRGSRRFSCSASEPQNAQDRADDANQNDQRDLPGADGSYEHVSTLLKSRPRETPRRRSS